MDSEEGVLIMASNLINARTNRVIVLEELNFLWDESELDEIVQMYEQKVSIDNMSNYLKRDSDEVALAIMHLGRMDRIKTT